MKKTTLKHIIFLKPKDEGQASQVALDVKNPPANATDVKDEGSIRAKIRKIPWGRAWQPSPVFLPGDSHGQRNLTGYSPWGLKESDVTEVT